MHQLFWIKVFSDLLGAVIDRETSAGGQLDMPLILVSIKVTATKICQWPWICISVKLKWVFSGNIKLAKRWAVYFYELCGQINDNYIILSTANVFRYTSLNPVCLFTHQESWETTDMRGQSWLLNCRTGYLTTPTGIVWWDDIRPFCMAC